MEFIPVDKLNVVTRERDELAVLVDGAYTFIELYKPEGEYNKTWRENWLKKAQKLVPGCDSLDA